MERNDPKKTALGKSYKMNLSKKEISFKKLAKEGRLKKYRDMVKQYK